MVAVRTKALLPDRLLSIRSQTANVPALMTAAHHDHRGVPSRPPRKEDEMASDQSITAQRVWPVRVAVTAVTWLSRVLKAKQAPAPEDRATRKKRQKEIKRKLRGVGGAG
jgi:hypothetical protein